MAQKKLSGKSTAKKDGQHRKETKEERKARLQSQQEARDQCLKLLPYAMGALILLLLAFSLYVRSVPVKQPKVKNATAAFTPDLGQTPADAVPPDVAEAASSSVETTATDEATASSSSQETVADSATIEL